ncbi:hypothetical protein [Yeosuana sp. AK3]|nr:hypothetical protein [Flavobacteriia bacterium]NCP05981.1 hypothetical protein [Flavobacteriales bacterium]NCP59295.1 hypothetical protein [Flavobacteriales bacterium]NCP89709.1 hypothetical protein [Flavobacteriales bacterium]NCQ15739.1 hypothetical protein [Flavobacteriales bacterium]
MSPHFCKVGKIKPNVNKLLSLKELENRIANFVEDVSKIDLPESYKSASI